MQLQFTNVAQSEVCFLIFLTVPPLVGSFSGLVYFDFAPTLVISYSLAYMYRYGERITKHGFKDLLFRVIFSFERVDIGRIFLKKRGGGSSTSLNGGWSICITRR